MGYRRFFSFIPFLDFTIAAGSLVFGKIHENSDFDVIVGAKSGRIFTVRFFCFLIFELAGVRRKKLAVKEEKKDKVCFCHFVAPTGYKLRPPYNVYWEKLYQNLVPVYGKRKAIRVFFEANDSLIKGRPHLFGHFDEQGFNFFRVLMERILGGLLGDFIEESLKKIQLKRIHKSISTYGTGFMPRLRFDDDELEFHPDTSRIEIMVNSKR